MALRQRSEPPERSSRARNCIWSSVGGGPNSISRRYSPRRLRDGRSPRPLRDTLTPNRLRDVSAPETSPRRKQPSASPRQNDAKPSPRRPSPCGGVSATSQRPKRLRDRMTPNRLRDAPAVVAASPRRLSAQNVSATDPRRRGASPRQKTGRFSSPRRKLGDFRLRDEKMDDFRLRDEKHRGTTYQLVSEGGG